MNKDTQRFMKLICSLDAQKLREAFKEMRHVDLSAVLTIGNHVLHEAILEAQNMIDKQH